MEQEQLKELLRNPTETLQSEIKSWLDLGAPDDRAKIARALLSLRNRNGGQLIFGFDDKTGEPAGQGRPVDLRAAFHADKVQELVIIHAK
jgi:predicted HTH transcriptional regulator